MPHPTPEDCPLPLYAEGNTAFLAAANRCWVMRYLLGRLALELTPDNTLVALCGVIGVSENTLHEWIAKGRTPAERAKQLEDLAPGIVKREWLCPAVYA